MWISTKRRRVVAATKGCGFFSPDKGWLLTRKLLKQGFLLLKLKSSHRKIYHDLVDRNGIYASQMTTICSICRKHFLVLSSFMAYHLVCSYTNRTGDISGAELLILPKHLSSPPVLVRFVLLDLYVYVYLSFSTFFSSLCCTSFFELRILITPLVSSNFTYHNLAKRFP